MAKKTYTKMEVRVAARPRSERLRSAGASSTSGNAMSSPALLALKATVGAHVADSGIHVTEDEKTLWNLVASLFGVDEDGNVYVKGDRGFYGTSFISSHGLDPEAGGAGVGLDIDELWSVLGASGTEKIDASHIPALSQLSGTLTNAQLANSAISVAGVSVSLGGAVSTAQIASALTAAGYKLTDNDTTYTLTKSGSTITLTGSNGSKTSVTDSNTTYTLGSFGITATAAELNKLDGLATTATELGYVHGVTSAIQTQLNAKANASALASYALKDGSNASGTWGISISGTAAYATVLSSNSSTSVSNYLQYRQINGQTSLVGSNAVNGAWCLPTTGVDAGYGNGQILRFGWGQFYYTDLHTGPNEIGSNSGLQFRQVVAGAVSSLGWRTLLDTANYAGTLDTRYLLKSAYTASDILAKLKTVDGSGSGLDADLLDGYHSTSFDLATNLGACQDYGRYVIGLMQITDYTTAGNHANGELILIRHNGNIPTLKIIYSLATRYNTEDVRFGHLVVGYYGNYAVPCTFTHNGKKWAGFNVVTNAAYTEGVVCKRDGLRLGERSTPFMLKYMVSNTGEVLDPEVNGSLVLNGSDIVDDGVSTTRFVGALEGNATSATKLATARTIWGKPFDGTGNVSGDMTGVGLINGALHIAEGEDVVRLGTSNHVTEFYGYGYINKSYYFRPGYSSVGASTTRVYIQNASASDSPVFSTTHAFEASGNATHTGLLTTNGLKTTTINATSDVTVAGNVGIGTTSPSYKLTVVGTGNFTGRVFAQNGVTIGSTDDIGWYPGNSRINAGWQVARGVNVGDLLVSNAWADMTKVPTNGIYSKGAVLTDSYLQVGSGRLRWDAANNALYVEKSDGTACGLYSTGFLSSHDADPGAGTAAAADNGAAVPQYDLLRPRRLASQTCYEGSVTDTTVSPNRVLTVSDQPPMLRFRGGKPGDGWSVEVYVRTSGGKNSKYRRVLTAPISECTGESGWKNTVYESVVLPWSLMRIFFEKFDPTAGRFHSTPYIGATVGAAWANLVANSRKGSGVTSFTSIEKKRWYSPGGDGGMIRSQASCLYAYAHFGVRLANDTLGVHGDMKTFTISLRKATSSNLRNNDLSFTMRTD